MPDISMCRNLHCPSKDYCHRFTATPSELWQSYANFGPEDDETSCSYFWPNGKDSNKCKHNGVKREGEICNLEQCNYPKCTQDDYCSKCGQTDAIHKMSCPTHKIQINL
jgi:hypothetical protein